MINLLLVIKKLIFSFVTKKEDWHSLRLTCKDCLEVSSIVHNPLVNYNEAIALACYNGNQVALNYLLGLVNETTVIDYYTNILLAIDGYYKDFVLAILKSKYIKIDQKQWTNLLFVCIDKRNYDIFEPILKYTTPNCTFNINHKEESPALSEHTLLTYACSRGATDIVSLLLKTETIDLFVRVGFTYDKNCLYYASYRQDTTVFRILIKDDRIKKNSSVLNEALMSATINNNIAAILVLLEDPDIDIPQWGWAPLYSACFNAQLAIIELFLESHRIPMPLNGFTVNAGFSMFVKDIFAALNVDRRKKLKLNP
jgi:ankyrin repeat protein